MDWQWGSSLTITRSPSLKLTSLYLVSVICFIIAWAFKSFFLNLVKTDSLLVRRSSTPSKLVVPARYWGKLKGFLPKVISYGEALVPECHEVLYDYSTQFRNFPHDDGFLWTKARRHCSMTRLSTLICLSVCGWYTELICNQVPLILNSACQKWLMNKGSWSKTRLWGISWSFPTISIKRTTTVWEVWWVGNIPKWMPFEKWSTTTRMVMCPWKVGKLTMKSRERSSYGQKGIDKGQSNPTTFLVLYFVCWQSMHMTANGWWVVLHEQGQCGVPKLMTGLIVII